MKTKTHKEHLTDIHMNTAAMSLAALLTVFHLYMEMPKHAKHALHNTSESSHSLFEREREVHPNHPSYGARAKLATVGAN